MSPQGSPRFIASDNRDPQRRAIGCPLHGSGDGRRTPNELLYPAIIKYDGTTNPQENLSHFENVALSHRYTNGIKCRIFITTFHQCCTIMVQPIACWSHRKFSRISDNESLKEYLQRLNTVALEVPSATTLATQEVSASSFSQGLLDGYLFKSQAKNHVFKFDALLASAGKHINMEDAQSAKKESPGRRRKKCGRWPLFKKPWTDYRDKKARFQRVNVVYTPLMVPIIQALITVEGKGLLVRPLSWREQPQHPNFE
ncbi:UNVERIFIED_CONTAM: hypothetical protein Sindi_3023500, partial [Sesamum indicum]